MFSIVKEIVTLTKGEKAIFEVALKTENEKEYKLNKKDFLILVVRDKNKELFSAESEPGSNKIVILPEMTQALSLGEYKYAMYLESNGQRKKLTIDSNKFILC